MKNLLYNPEYFSEKEFYNIYTMSPMLVFIIDKIRAKFEGMGIFIIHSSNEPEDLMLHIPGSYHYQGLAVDFHIKLKSDPKAHKKLSEYKRICEALMFEIKSLRINKEIGLGIYPYWNNPGFHIDYRHPKGPGTWFQNEAGGYMSIAELNKL